MSLCFHTAPCWHAHKIRITSNWLALVRPTQGEIKDFSMGVGAQTLSQKNTQSNTLFLQKWGRCTHVSAKITGGGVPGHPFKFTPDNYSMENWTSIDFDITVNCYVILVVSPATFQELIRTYETDWGRSWYHKNVSGKRKFGSNVEV